MAKGIVGFVIMILGTMVFNEGYDMVKIAIKGDE